jgi:predicted DNA-binding transcriptional regulator AlpA
MITSIPSHTLATSDNTVTEASELLCISRTNLWRLVTTGGVPCIKLFRPLKRFNKSAILAVLERTVVEEVR